MEFFWVVAILALLNVCMMPGEKLTGGGLHKNALCFEQILEVALYKTAAVRPLTSHLIN